MKVTIEDHIEGTRVTVEEAHSGAVVMPSDQGMFSIQHRDSGIEVCLNGKLHWSSTSGYFPSSRRLRVPGGARPGGRDLLDANPALRGFTHPARGESVWSHASDMTKYWTDVYVAETSLNVRMQVVVVRDHLAWAITFGSIGGEVSKGGVAARFLSDCDAEYLARKMETPQHETDWTRIDEEVGTCDTDAVLAHYGDAERVPQKETERFACARRAAQAVIDDCKLRRL